jgi:Mn-dependent DtxR family transcriptional regulator
MKEEDSRLSSSLEDYLKEIYMLHQDSEEVRVTDIAKDLGISKPSVNRAMNTLKEMNLLEHEHYGTITLTQDGMAKAKNIFDTYKVLYKFLTEVLGVDEATASEEADLMEHTIGKSTRKKIKKLIKSTKKNK